MQELSGVCETKKNPNDKFPSLNLIYFDRDISAW